MLHFKNVQKQYGNTTILDIPVLTIEPGIVWLQGENGSGKTTLLKMAAGLLPFKGDIELAGGISFRKQRQQFVSLVNYGETEPSYPDFLTAKELVKLHAFAKKGNVAQTEALLEELHMTHAYNKPIATYSSGMAKKLGLALAFCGRPEWILLDEPLVTLDVASVQIICNTIKAAQEQQGIAFLITSHQAFASGQLPFTKTLLAANQTISPAI